MLGADPRPAQQGLYPSEEVTAKRGDPDEAKLVRALFAAGLRHLARMSASTASVRRILERRLVKLVPPDPSGGPAEVDKRPIETAIGRLHDLGYLDDVAFARGKSRSLTIRGLSKLGVRQQMVRHGVDRDVAAAAYDALVDDIDEPEVAAARAFVRKRKLGWHRPAEERTAQRLADLAKLLRHGFPADIARAALDEPEDDVEPDGSAL